jgi:sporulation protein YlmC with PRC-barrel domain
MPTIEETVEVDVPVRTAYDQWTRFEEFPRFMEGVREVRRIDDTHLHWVAEMAGREAEWDAEIVEQEPERRIAWRSTGGLRNDGDVAFEAMGDDATRVRVSIEHDPEGVAEHAAELLGLAQRRVRRDMERFKDLVEARSASAAAGTEGGARDVRDRATDDTDAAVGPEDYPETTRLPSLSRLRGLTVVNREDEKVGKVREVYLDAGADHVRYLGVSTGWLSRGTHVVPVDDVTYVDDGSETYIVVPYSVEHLKAAPSLDDDDELSAEREREIYDHYARVGYWDEARDAIKARQTPPAPTPRIAEAEVVDAIRRGEDPAGVRVTRWGS